MAEENLEVQSVSGMAVDLPLVDIGGRSFAYVLDFIFSFILAVGWVFLVAYLIGTGFSLDPIAAIKSLDESEWKKNLFVWVGLIPAYVFFLLYHPLLEWWMKGQTFGKRLAGIRIVMQDGTESRPVPIFIRNLFRLIDSLPSFYLLGLIVAMFNKRHLRIGDMAAGTVLVYEEKPKKFEQYLQHHFNSNIPARELDLLIELNQRWQSLGRKQRIELATRLFNKLDMAADVEGLSSREQDQLLQQQLKQLLEG
jgi:uncharacterized RDD family membrane protein YckC